MLKINFVPDDYVQTNESHRTNLIYLALFILVMAGLYGCFMTIKWRQQALNEKEKAIDIRMTQKQQEIGKVEELQAKRNAMWKTALTTADLIEPTLRSLILAEMTNLLPTGTSFMKLNIIQKEPPRSTYAPASKYQAQKTTAAKKPAQPVNREKLIETDIEFEGIAPSDIQVAMYLENLNSSEFFNSVALVESKEHKSKDSTIRQFKMTAKLNKKLHIEKEDVEAIKVKKTSIYSMK